VVNSAVIPLHRTWDGIEFNFQPEELLCRHFLLHLLQNFEANTNRSSCAKSTPLQQIEGEPLLRIPIAWKLLKLSIKVGNCTVSWSQVVENGQGLMALNCL
jgi:hypothetical protein